MVIWMLWQVSIAKFANGSPKEQEEQVEKLRTS